MYLSHTDVSSSWSILILSIPFKLSTSVPVVLLTPFLFLSQCFLSLFLVSSDPVLKECSGSANKGKF